jgi:GT2 family glycosyltransferase
VLIITRGKREHLEKALESIRQVDYPDSLMQCVVVEETDTPQPVGEGIEYHAIPVRNLGFGYARNRALEYARNPLIIFTDDDCRVHRRWVRELVRPLIEEIRISAVSGAVFVPPCGPVGKCENIIGFPGGGLKYFHAASGKIVKRSTFSTCNCAIRRTAIDTEGDFDESMKYGGEDERLSRRIAESGTIVYNPDAIVYHQPRDSLRGVFRWFVRRGFAEVHRSLAGSSVSNAACSFLRNALIVRLLAVWVISLLSRAGLRLLLPLMIGYYALLLWKFRWAWHYYPSISTMLCVPVVRWVMDTGRDVGIMRGISGLQTESRRVWDS